MYLFMLIAITTFATVPSTTTTIEISTLVFQPRDHLILLSIKLRFTVNLKFVKKIVTLFARTEIGMTSSLLLNLNRKLMLYPDQSPNPNLDLNRNQNLNHREKRGRQQHRLLFHIKWITERANVSTTVSRFVRKTQNV